MSAVDSSGRRGAPPASSRTPAWVRHRHWLGLACLLGVIAYSSAIRIALTLRDPSFDRASPAGMLRTDPAFLYYVTGRIVDAGGRPPSDFRADPRLEWPETTDIPAIETVGQEFFVAWTYLAFARGTPLHVWCVWAMGVFASLVTIGIYGSAWELTRRVRWAVAAAALWALMLASYRTLGFVLIREDFAFPWFARHAWSVLRAARVRSAAAFALAGLSAVAAAATWHAMVFVLLIEAACLLAWWLRSGENPFAVRGAWLVPACAAAASLLVPVLRAKQFALSLPMQIAFAVLAAALVARRWKTSHATNVAAAAAAWLALLATSRAFAGVFGSGLADYVHVFDLLLAKLRYLGQMPEDPRGISFGARLLWQGPFATAEASVFVLDATAACVALAAGLVALRSSWLRGRGDARAAVLVAFTLAAAVATWLVVRTAPLFAMAGAVLGVVLLSRLRSGRLALALVVVACAAHGVLQAYAWSRFVNPWYALPPRAADNAALMRWIAASVPEDAAVASDFSTSAAILAHTGRPVLVQPKYETVRSRERIESFCRALYQGTPAQLAEWMREQRCSYLVVNRPFLGGNATLLGDILPSQLVQHRDKAIWHLMSEDPREFERVSGFELLARIPAAVAREPYRVYRLR